jgi:hypothetical protein
MRKEKKIDNKTGCPMRRFNMRRMIFVLGFLVTLALIFNPSSVFSRAWPAAAGEEVKEVKQVKDPAAGDRKAEQQIEVPPPPFSEGIFPCSECHAEQETNPQRRELVDAHDDIVLHHAEQNRWCLDCHDANNRDMLHMADGELVDFRESYKLCGQCHGIKLRDWRNGVHGKRIGHWNGQKEYFLCVHCHNPHSPRFKALKPEPPPVKPGSIKR